MHLYFFTRIKFFNSHSFGEMREISKEYYVIRDVSAEGGYSIILELSSNGKINNTIS